MIDLAPARIEALLQTARYGRSLDVRAETGSTNDDARLALAGGAVDGHVVLADRQREGRGARGRRWDSPGGTDLYFSIVARVPVPLARIAPLTLAVGLGVSRAVGSLVSREVRVKWPNDVWLDGKKCAGILIEASVRGAESDGVVIGIGLDVNRERFEGELADIATSLRREHDASFDRALVLARTLGAVEEEVDRFVSGGARSVVERVDRLLALRGERVRCDEHEGTFVGLSPDGALRLLTDDGVRTLVAGTLRAR